jgi:hypothetical protein
MTIDFTAHYDRNLSGHEMKTLIRKLVPCSPKETGEYPEAIIGIPEREYHRLEANVQRCGSQLKTCQEKVRKLSQITVKPVPVKVHRLPSPKLQPVPVVKLPKLPGKPKVARTCGSACIEANRMLKLFRKLGIK